jgi:hypothetical protein
MVTSRATNETTNRVNPGFQRTVFVCSSPQNDLVGEQLGLWVVRSAKPHPSVGREGHSPTDNRCVPSQHFPVDATH